MRGCVSLYGVINYVLVVGNGIYFFFVISVLSLE